MNEQVCVRCNSRLKTVDLDLGLRQLVDGKFVQFCCDCADIVLLQQMVMLKRQLELVRETHAKLMMFRHGDHKIGVDPARSGTDRTVYSFEDEADEPTLPPAAPAQLTNEDRNWLYAMHIVW